MGKIRAIMKKEAGEGLTLEYVEEPQIISPKDVKIKVLNASICGSDVHIWKWDSWAQKRIKPPMIIGHEFVGEVVEVGEEVVGFKKGDIVVSETHIPCGVCYQCKTGRMHVCKNTKIIGVDRDGAFADYIVLPEIVLWKIDPSIPKEYASVMEPLGNAIHTATVTDLRGRSVLITGVGPIGAMAIEVAKVSGAALVIVSEISDYRIEMAKNIGADVVINPLKEDLVAKVMELTDGNGVDVFMEMSGSEQALNDGLKSLTNGGVASILGIYREDEIKIRMNEAIFKGITMYLITGRRMFETWYIASQWLKYKKIDLSKIVTHVFEMEDFKKGIDLMLQGKSGKIVLKIN